MFNRLIPAAGLAVTVVVGAPTAATAAVNDWMPSEGLRVCADSNLMPFSNDKGEGFENRIAEMIGAELGLPVTYYHCRRSSGLCATHCVPAIAISSSARRWARS